MNDQPQQEPTFFSVPATRWSDVDRESYELLAKVHVAIGLALTDYEKLHPDIVGNQAAMGATFSSLDAPPPAELALDMHEVAGRLLAMVAGDEQDLRQIIGTLRTALAVCWDLYSVRESERVTVIEHMHNLRRRIDDFEQELRTIRIQRGDATLTESNKEESTE